MIDLLADGEREPVGEFLEDLKAKRLDEYKRIVAVLARAGLHGPPGDERTYRTIKSVSGQLAEFKGHQARIMCCFDGTRRIVLTHGFIKKKNKTGPEEIARAVRLRDGYLLEKMARARQGRGR